MCRHRHFVIILACIGIALSFFASNSPTLPFDVTATHLLQSKVLLPLLPLMTFVSLWGFMPWVVIISFIFSALCFTLQLKKASIFVWLTFINYPLDTVIKLLVHRARPTPDVAMIYQHFKDYGFPSGHVTHYTVFYGFLLFVFIHANNLSKMARTLLITYCAGLIILIGPSRIYLGVHWLSDVIGGYVLGVVVLLLLIKLYRKENIEE